MENGKFNARLCDKARLASFFASLRHFDFEFRDRVLNSSVRRSDSLTSLQTSSIKTNKQTNEDIETFLTVRKKTKQKKNRDP